MNRNLSVIVIVLFFPLVQCHGSLPKCADEILPEIIAQGKVISLESEGVFIKGNIKIQHVYKGPKNLKGKVFTARSCVGETESPEVLTPEFKQGEMGIWPLSMSKKNQEKEILYECPGGFLGCVSRKGVKDPLNYGILIYDWVKSVAEVTEKFGKIPEGKKIEFLKGHITNKNPLLSEFAVRFLSLMGKKEEFKFLREEITHGRLSFYVQTIIDEALNKKDQSWAKSEDRKKIFKKWVTQKIPSNMVTDAAFIRAFIQIGRAFRKGSIQDIDFYLLNKTGIENENLSLYSRKSCIGSLSSFYNNINNSDIKTGIFNYLILLTRKSKELKITAAYALRRLSFNKEKIEILRKLSNEIDDEKLKKIIDKIIKTNIKTETRAFENSP